MRATQSTPQVFMNAGGGGAAAAAGGPVQQLRPFNHLLHIFLSVITAGLWLPIWLLMYVIRNKAVYF